MRVQPFTTHHGSSSVLRDHSDRKRDMTAEDWVIAETMKQNKGLKREEGEKWGKKSTKCRVFNWGKEGGKRKQIQKMNIRMKKSK